MLTGSALSGPSSSLHIILGDRRRSYFRVPCSLMALCLSPERTLCISATQTMIHSHRNVYIHSGRICHQHTPPTYGRPSSIHESCQIFYEDQRPDSSSNKAMPSMRPQVHSSGSSHQTFTCSYVPPFCVLVLQADAGMLQIPMIENINAR